MIKTFIDRETKVLFALLIVFLFSSNLALFVLGIAGIFVFINKYLKRQSKNFVLLLIALLLYFVHGVFINGLFNIWGGLMVVLPSIVLYLCGNYFAIRWKYGEIILFLLFLVSLTIALPHFYYTISDIFQNGLINPHRYLSILGEDQQIITQRAILISLCTGAIGLAPLWSLKGERSVRRLIRFFVALSFVAVLCVIHYVSRTGVVIFLVSFIVGQYMNSRKSKYRNVFLLIVFCVLLFYVSFETEVGIVFMERNNDTLFQASGRSGKWELFFNLLLQNPMGIENLAYVTSTYAYAHNLWLDFGKYGGLLSFVLLSVFSIINIIKCCKVFFNKSRSDILLKQLCFLFAIVFFLANMTEPILEGVRPFWFAYCFYCGLTDNL